MLANVSFGNQISQPLVILSQLLEDSQGPSQGYTPCTTSVSPAPTSSRASTPVTWPGTPVTPTPVADVMSDAYGTIDPQLTQELLDPHTQQEGEERIVSVVKKEKKKDEQ